MKIVRTTGKSASRTEATLAALESRGSVALDTVLPAVKRIVANVRKHGDSALLRYAVQFDGLQDETNLRVTQEEMLAAWRCV